MGRGGANKIKKSVTIVKTDPSFHLKKKKEILAVQWQLSKTLVMLSHSKTKANFWDIPIHI